MVWVVPIARATFDRCGVVLGGSATLPEAPGRGAYRALGLRGVLMVRGVVLRAVVHGRPGETRDHEPLRGAAIIMKAPPGPVRMPGKAKPRAKGEVTRRKADRCPRR
jgi:hypothetical protein